MVASFGMERGKIVATVYILEGNLTSGPHGWEYIDEANSKPEILLLMSNYMSAPRFYGFPISFLEAFITDCPILTTNCGDTLEELQNGAI